MANILDTAPQDWRYVSEGGATIVFSYMGPSLPEFDGTVLRLRKSAASATNPHQEASNSVSINTGLENEQDEPDDPTIEYQTKCMQWLIPPEHLPRLQTVKVNRLWLEELSRLHNAARPEERRLKDEVDLTRKKGVLATDLVGGHWLAIEIKPKWAFLPSPTHLSEETQQVKTQTCRFCMHSHLRFQTGRQEVTDYCPLDLFSGDETRIRKAIHSLWGAWVASNATINNLKIFAGGKFLVPSEFHLMLLEGKTAGSKLDAVRDAFVTAVTQTLLQTPVLRILSNLQRSLDPLDIEGLSKLWKLTESSVAVQTSQGSESAPSLTPLGASSPFFQSTEPNISDWVDFLDTYTSARRPDSEQATPTPEDLRYYLLAYLLSATFKDCSIIVKMDFLQSSPQSSTAMGPNTVTVIDLDPKRFDKLKSWEKLDHEIARAYALVRQKTCVDAWKTAR